MSEKVEVELPETVARTAQMMARDIWFSSGKNEPNLSDAAQFLDLVACCAYALRGKRIGLKPGEF